MPGTGFAPLAIDGETMCCSIVPGRWAVVKLLTVSFQKLAALTGLKSGSQPEDVAGA